MDAVGWQNPIRIWSTDTLSCLGQPWGTMPSRTSGATISGRWLLEARRDGWNIATPQALELVIATGYVEAGELGATQPQLDLLAVAPVLLDIELQHVTV